MAGRDERDAGVVAVIPARYGSTRLPRKALLNDTGKFLVQHVWDRVRSVAGITRVIIATDHESIERAARSFGAEVMMTSADHQSGTDRVHEVARRIDASRIVNVQGDEPEVDANGLQVLARALQDGCSFGTLACPFRDVQMFVKPNHVKVVCDAHGNALYFSRAPIPWSEGGALPTPALLHLGVYGFDRATLERFASLTPSTLEKSERLEQLRALENGIAIRVFVTPHEFAGIDTKEDYAAFVARERARIQRS